MSNNLFEITSFDDLCYFLKTTQNKFTVLTIINDSTDQTIVSGLKKYITFKSKKYQKIYFIFYKMSNSDIGKLKPMFEGEQNMYPKMFHIWNIKTILTDVMAIDNADILEESFALCHDGYMLGCIPENQDNHENQDNPENQDNQENLEGQNNQENQEYQDNLELQEPQENHQTITLLETQKKCEKLNLLKKYQQKTIKSFFKDIKQRKEKEEIKTDK